MSLVGLSPVLCTLKIISVLFFVDADHRTYEELMFYPYVGTMQAYEILFWRVGLPG